MNTHTEQAKIEGKIKIIFAYTSCYDKPCLKYQALGEKIEHFINNRKTELNSGMIEIFYYRLLPVTCRDWMRK